MTTWRLSVDGGAASAREVLLRAPDDATIDDLLRALDDRGMPARSLAVDGRPVPSQARLTDAGLVHGSVVELGSPRSRSVERSAGYYLVAVSGPEAGSWWRLPSDGQLVIGRGNEADVSIRDPLVSSRHLTVQVASDAEVADVTVEDLRSSNGTLLEGEPLTGRAHAALGTYVQVGSTVLTVLEVDASDLPVEATPRRGARAFQRHFREALDPLPQHLLPPAEPSSRSGDAARSWWQYLIPVVTGAGFALMTGRWIFLLLIALAPIAMLVQHLRRQRREAREEREKERVYQEALENHERELARVRALERDRRRRAAVVGGEAILMAQLRHRRLWERVADDPDHLEVCVGLADQPSMVRTSRDGSDEPGTLWAVPLSVSLPETGSLLVSGDPVRSRAVGRSMVLNLAATHSPHELHVTVLTTVRQEADWNWARWLPHTFVDGGATSIHSTTEQRDAAVASLLRQIQAREEDGGGAAHIVIVDGADTVDGSRLTTILTRGADVGVHGIVLDAHVTPEGVRGTLTLGQRPDEGVFASRHVARAGGILTAELAVPWAERAARALGGLRPPAGDEHGGPSAENHLTDLVASEPITTEWVRSRWAASSPQEQVAVGLAGRTPIEMDIVRHGPHAIVGGATRSGKTEFLLTWLTALCLANSPDDLAIFVADFKGGVDHVQTAKLPHVISLVTNQDIRAFERTLVMLEAEIERRQDVFATAGTSNIEAYRTARQRDDSLVPVPRLLVVVDEFSELRQADREGGGGYMGRLESMARVGAGLGVHLVLVTQNFSGGQLSDQIEGQVGMGVCFRVEKDEHSKVVLGSPIASTIPAHLPGRAWARLRGGELTEFQCARVAGRRRDLVGAEPIELEFVPFASLPQPSAVRVSGAVPHDETDLARLIEVVDAAAGGKGPPVPWPEELSPSLHLAEVLDAGGVSGEQDVPIGLADIPERQQRQVALLDASDEQMMVVGGSAGDAAHTLITMAVATALRTAPRQTHLYGIDLEGNALQPLEALPHTGAVACLNDDLAMRIVRLLREEASRRRSLFETAGVADLAAYLRAGGEPLPLVRLFVRGADRLLGSSEGDASPLLRPISALAADAPGTGVGLVLTGGISLAGKRMTQRANRRFVLSLSDASDYGVVGVPRDRAVELEAPGRAWDVGRQQLVQWAAVASPDAGVAEVVEALGERLRDHHGGADRQGWPEQLPEVRWPVPWERVDRDSIVPPEGYDDALPLGIDTETAHWVWADAEEDGPLIAVGGDGRSGRSTTLLALARLAVSLGWQVRAVAATRRSPLHGLAADGVPVSTSLSGLEPAVGRTLYLVDDANRLPEDGTGLDKLIDDASAPLLVAIAGPIDLFGRKTGVLRGTPDIRVAMTLAPTLTTGTANVRLPDHLRVDPRPGRGALWSAGEFRGLQIPHVTSGQVHA